MCALTCTISLGYCGISLSYMLFHFSCAISAEQQFSPYIFEWAFTRHTIKIYIYLTWSVVLNSAAAVVNYFIGERLFYIMFKQNSFIYSYNWV